MATKKSQLILTCNAQAIKDIFDYLNDKLAKIKLRRDALLRQYEGKMWTTEAKKEFKQLGDDIAAITSMQQKNEEQMRKYGQVMQDLAGSKLRDVKGAVREVTNALNKMSEKDPNRQKLIDDLAKLKNEIAVIGGTRRSLTDVTNDLKNLANVRFDQLQQDLEAVRAKYAQLSETQRNGAVGLSLKNSESLLQAQIGVSQYGRAGTSPLQAMTDEQLRAEQSRLRSLYMSTQGATGFEGISKDALDRLQKANQLIKDRAEAEREAARAAKEADEEAQRRIEFAQQGQRTHQTLANMEKASYEDLEAALKHLQEQYKTYASGDVKHIQRNLAAQDQLKQRMKDMQSVLLSEQQLLDRIQNKRKYNITELQQAYEQLKSVLASIPVGEKQAIESVQRDMKSLQKEIKKANGELTGFAKLWNTALKNIGAYMGVFAVAGFFKNKIQGMVRDNLSLSDSMVQVQKVTGLMSDEIKQLNVNLAKLDTRTTLTQLNELAYSAGKMGLGKYGLEGVEGFVRAANQLQVALGEDLGASVDEAITPLAKLAENLGLIQKMGVEKSMMAIGSSINELSQTTTAAGKNIVDFARRIQPSAQMIGLTTDEILALGSATDSFGVSAEVSATAFTKFLAAYRTNTVEIERILNMVPGTLDKFFDEGRAIEGLMAIFQRMHEMGDLRYLEDAFKALGSEGSKMFLTFGAFSKNIDMFREHLITSNEAFAEAVSITEEFNLVQATAEGIMERANNMWQNAFVNPEGVDTIKQLAEGWYNLTKQLTESTNWLTGIKNSLELIAWVASNLLKILPELTKALFFFGVAKAIRYITTEVHIMNAAMASATTNAGRLSAVLRSNVWVLAVTAIALVGAKLYDMAKASQEAADKLDVLKEAEKEAEDESRKQRVELKKLYEATKDQTKSIEERKDALRKMVGDEKYNQYYKQLSNEKDLATAAASAYRDLTEEIFRSAQARAYANKIEELENKRMEKEDEKAKKEQWRKENKGSYEAGKREYQNQQDYVEEATRSTAGFPETQIARRGAAAMKPKIIDEYEGTEKAIANIDDDIKGIDADMEKLKDKIRGLNLTPEPAGGGGGGGGTGRGDTGGSGADKDIKERLRKELKDAKEQSDAVISKIEEWYRLQETVITDMQADGKLTKEQAEQVVRTLNIAKNTALRDARLAISGRDTKAWEQTKQQIGDLMLDQGKWSQELLEQILGVSMKNIRANLAKIDKGGGKYGITTSSLKDAVDKNAAGNQREIARLMARAQQEVEKIFMEYDFFEQAMRGFSNRLAQMGILSETARNMAERLTDANDVNTIFSMKDYDALLKGNEGAKQQMLQAFIASGAQPYGVNPEDKEQLRAWFMEFVGEFVNNGGVSPLGEGVPNVEYQYQSWAKPFEADFDLWLRDSDKYLASIQSFYLSLMKSEEDYYEKRKQSYNHYKKQLEQQDQAAGIPTQREDTERRLQTQATLQENGIGASFWRQQGLGGILNDPEVMLIQQRIEWRNQDLESAKALLAGKEALWQQEKAQRLAAGENEASIEADLSQRRMGFEDIIKERQSALFDQQLAFTTKIAQEMRKRVQTVNNLTKPIQDGAKNIGQKFGEMIRGIEEQSMTWKEIWHSMAVAVGESVIDMTAQYAQNMIMEKMMNQQSKQEAISKAQVDVAAGTASAAAKTVGQLGWWGLALIPVIAAVLHGLLAAAFASNKQSDTSKSATAPKLKLVSGMLTYDEGNVGTYLGQDGRVYRAREDAAPKTGLITKPIATTVQGQPALVAERGPEIVIGRKTTKRIQMAAPELLHAIQLIDRGYTPRRLYDEGTPLPATVPAASPAGQQSDQDAQMQQTLAALTQTVAVLSATVTQLQQKGIPAHINKYGAGGLIDEVKSGLRFDARYNK